MDSGVIYYPQHYLSGFVFYYGLVIDGIKFQLSPINTPAPTLSPVDLSGRMSIYDLFMSPRPPFFYLKIQYFQTQNFVQ